MGEVFAGRYELVDPIGRGGVGAVWRAWDHRRRRYVAAKVLQQSDAHALLRFVREQATRIDHPHVLAPASWAADDDKVLFTMDLVRGGSLSHLVGDYGPLPPHYVVVLLDQLLAGLTAVHAEGIVHRDIKPANILLEATGTGTPHVRLSDFGISMRKGDARLTETNYVVGTPGYFAPEQLMGAEPDFPADLYAAGLVALYLLGGRKPDAEAIQERFLAMGMPPAPLGVPEPLWQVVGALLQPDPHARFRTATGARKALAAAIELIPEPAPGEEPVEIFDLIGQLPDGFGPEGPPTATATATPTPTPESEPEPEPVPSAVEAVAVSSTTARTPQPPGAPEPAGPCEPAQPSGPSEPPQARQEPAEPATDFPLPPPRPAPQPVPQPVSQPVSQPVPPSVPQPAPRPQGRHAAPLPAHEPLTHTRTRAEQSVPVSQPLPEPQYADPRIHPEPSYAPPQFSEPVAQAELSRPPVTPTRPLPQPLPATPARQRQHAHGEDTASAQLPARGPRPGPPAKLAVPILVIAAICFAVGILALLAS